MAGAFPVRECFPISVTPVSYDWGGTFDGTATFFDLGPEYPIPFPWDPFDGCTCPTVSVSVHPGSLPGGNMSVAINPRDNDCCALDFVFDVWQPCIPSLHASATLDGIFKSRGGIFNLATTGDGCDFNISGIINFPCPTLFTSSNITKTSWGQRLGNASLKIGSTGDCEWCISLDVSWPCPTKINNALVTNTNIWPSRTGNASLTVNSIANACEWDISLNMQWPCPTLLSVGPTVNTNDWTQRLGDASLKFTPIPEDNCGWILDLSLVWPCPTALDVGAVNQYDYERKDGILTVTSAKLDECSWDIDIGIIWPCPTFIHTNAAINRNFHYDGPIRPEKQGFASLVITSVPGCNFQVGIDVLWPCPPTILWYCTNRWLWDTSIPPMVLDATIRGPRVVDRRRGLAELWFTEANCEFTANFDIQWPCPPLIKACISNWWIWDRFWGSGWYWWYCNHKLLPYEVRAFDPELRHGLMAASVHEENCEFEISWQIFWPCPTKFQEGILSAFIGKHPAKTLNVGLKEAGDCIFDFNFELTFPCPTRIQLTNTTWQSVWEAPGDLTITGGEPDDACNIQLGFMLTTPCTAVDMQFDIALDLEPAGDPYWEIIGPQLQPNCGILQSNILHLPIAPLTVDIETGGGCYENAVVNVEWDEFSRALKFTKGKVIGHWG